MHVSFKKIINITVIKTLQKEQVPQKKTLLDFCLKKYTEIYMWDLQKVCINTHVVKNPLMDFKRFLHKMILSISWFTGPWEYPQVGYYRAKRFCITLQEKTTPVSFSHSLLDSLHLEVLKFTYCTSIMVRILLKNFKIL